MKIKRNAVFRLFAYGKDKNRYQIRFRVTFNSQRLDLKTGCQLVDAKAWDDEAQLVKSGYKGPKGETALSINNELRNIKDQMDSTFKDNKALPNYTNQAMNRDETSCHSVSSKNRMWSHNS